MNTEPRRSDESAGETPRGANARRAIGPDGAADDGPALIVTHREVVLEVYSMYEPTGRDGPGRAPLHRCLGLTKVLRDICARFHLSPGSAPGLGAAVTGFAGLDVAVWDKGFLVAVVRSVDGRPAVLRLDADGPR